MKAKIANSRGSDRTGGDLRSSPPMTEGNRGRVRTPG